MNHYKFFKVESWQKNSMEAVGLGLAGSQHPEGPTVVVAASVPEALIAKLDELAEQRGWNRSEAVTEAIRRLVKAKR